MECLGHMIYPTILGAQKTKVNVISKVIRPNDVSWLRAFLGLANCYQQFVKRFKQIEKPLTQLTKVDEEDAQE
jgi:ribosomal 50S subunit-associated protein YjgA (DUF615 family)